MDMSNQDYQAYVKAKSKPSPLFRNMVWAFFVGGLICVIGQGLTDMFRAIGVEDNQVSSVTAMTLMAAAALLTGLGVFDRIAKFAGAGTLVPITGFANAMVSSAMEFRSEGVITGLAVKLFTVAGPVLVFGISASVVLGLILVMFGLA
ncbi:MAG: Stage sporulation protein (SpoVAC) [Firmicutes bacterium]|nr:Stage sporulation protein (SpoVAC) [Bacillota bacterium]